MKQKQTVKKILVYIQRYRMYLIFSIVTALVTVAFTLYIPILIGKAIDCIVGKGNVSYEKIFFFFSQIAVFSLTAALSQWIMNLINNKLMIQLMTPVTEPTI